MKGQALTVASTLRRILLNELSAVNITNIHVLEPKNVLHEYSLLNGFKESLPEIMNNLRTIVFRLFLLEKEVEDSQVKRDLDVETKSLFTWYAEIESLGKGIITAKDIKFLPEKNTKKKVFVTVVDETQYIAAAVSSEAKLHLNIELTQSKKYLSCIEQSYPKDKNTEIHIPITASFTPVKRVNYSIKQNANFTYEFILLEIWTDGSITPTEALGHSSIAAKQLFQPFL